MGKMKEVAIQASEHSLIKLMRETEAMLIWGVYHEGTDTWVIDNQLGKKKTFIRKRKRDKQVYISKKKASH